MRPRKVVLTIEVVTDAPIKGLQALDVIAYGEGGLRYYLAVEQVSANVIRAPKSDDLREVTGSMTASEVKAALRKLGKKTPPARKRRGKK